MSIVKLQQDLETVPDQFLAQESQQPSGQYPLYLVASEIQRRTDLRERFANQQQMGQAVQPPVLEQRIGQMMQQGIGGGLAPQAGQMPPQVGGGVMQGMGGPPAPQGAPVPPQGQPQGFQTGGRVVPSGPDDPASRFGAFGADRYQGMPLMGGIGNTISEGVSGAMGWLGDTWPGQLFGHAYRAGQMGGEEIERRLLGQGPSYSPSSSPRTDDLSRQLLSVLGPGAPGLGLQQEASPEQQAVLASVRAQMGAMSPERGLQLMRDNDAAIARMEAAGETAEGEISEAEAERRVAMQAYMDRLGATSAVEDAMRVSQKDPEQLAKERRSRALAQLGALIGGSRNTGDVASGMGAINESMYGMTREQEAEQRDVALALASARDERELRQTEVLLEMGREDVASAVGKLNRAQAMMGTAIQSRAVTANAAANLMDAMSRSQALLLEYGSGGQKTDPMDVLSDLFSGLEILKSNRPMGGGSEAIQHAQLTDQVSRAINSVLSVLSPADSPAGGAFRAGFDADRERLGGGR